MNFLLPHKSEYYKYLQERGNANMLFELGEYEKINDIVRGISPDAWDKIVEKATDAVVEMEKVLWGGMLEIFRTLNCLDNLSQGENCIILEYLTEFVRASVNNSEHVKEFLAKLASLKNYNDLENHLVAGSMDRFVS